MRNTNLTKPLGLLFLFCFIPFWALAQNITVKGVVKDLNGEPLLGVNVRQVGTTTGTVTDIEGNYTLQVKKDAKLLFSFVGFINQTVNVEGRNTINVTLKEDSKTLDEVVVVGYGTAKKSDVTGSIASINEKTLKEVPVSNVAQSMQGRIAGVQIQQTSTRPGSTSQIRIRGTRSLSATNDPLIIVDGIPFGGSLNDIAPDDIKSVDILKDASATAIYGSRGANGVILVTTNRGNYQKATVTYNGYAGFGNVAKKYQVFNAKEFLQMKEQPGAATWPLLSQEQEGVDNGTDTNWQDLMYETAIINSHDLSFKGGSENLSGSVGLGYYNETSVLPGQGYKRFSVRAALDYKINNWLKFGLNTQNTFGLTNGENANYMFSLLANSPLVAPYDADGNVVKQPHNPREDSYSPLLAKDSNTWTQERKRLSSLNSIYAEIQFLPELKYRANIGLNYSHDDYGDFYSSESCFKSGGLSSASTSYTTQYNYAVENLLYFDKTFNSKHHVGATIMQSVEDTYYRYSSLSGTNMTADYMQYYNMGMAIDGVAVDASKQNYYRKTLISYMGRLNYSYDSRYMATVTFRSDGSSVLSKGHKWHTYPAVALAWNAKNESFLKDNSWLDVLKLRVGYGQTSNQAVNPYSTLGSLSQNKYNYGTDYVYGYYVSTLPNKEVGWEYTTSYNAGIDWALFGGRISGNFDVYLQKTHDVLVYQSLPASSGVSGSILVNVGKTENKGFETAIHSQNFVAKKAGDFTWDTDFNLSLNRNKLLALNSGVTEDEGNGWFVGHPIDVIYDYNKIGIWQTAEATEAAKYNCVPGDIKIEDHNPDGKIDATDRYITRKFEPDFEFGFTNRFTFKNFDMDVVTYGQVGGTLVSTIHQPQAYVNRLEGRRNNLKVDYWREDNPTNAFPRINSAMVDTYYSTLGYYNASYWKIKTITLGYSIPDKFISKLKISGLRVYVTCNNVATLFSPYMSKAGGVDPQPTGYFTTENGGGKQESRQLTVGMNTPPTRQFLFGINFKL
ncbi:MAG: TonB-dependent receptor [Bacteroidetes bacterium]|nr:TonB-dependent receptor [Bacteroidota bacterium]